MQNIQEKKTHSTQLLDHLPAALAAEPPSTSPAAPVCWSLSVAFSAFDKTHGAGGPLNNRSVGLTGPLRRCPVGHSPLGNLSLSLFAASVTMLFRDDTISRQWRCGRLLGVLPFAASRPRLFSAPRSSGTP